MANEWTTEYPTQPGYYWLRNYQIDYRSHHGAIIPGPVIVEVDDDYITWTGDEMGVQRKHLISAEWFGPILPPQEEKPTSYRGIYDILEPPQDLNHQFTELFHNRLTNRGKQVLANQALDDISAQTPEPQD